MKELESRNRIAVEIVAEQQQKKEIRLIDTQRKIRGLILWEYNTKTKVLSRAQFKKQDVKITSLSMSPESITKSNKVMINSDCKYFQALNKENALKKIQNEKL